MTKFIILQKGDSSIGDFPREYHAEIMNDGRDEEEFNEYVKELLKSLYSYEYECLVLTEEEFETMIDIEVSKLDAISEGF
jgi:hypothetical protein